MYPADEHNAPLHIHYIDTKPILNPVYIRTCAPHTFYVHPIHTYYYQQCESCVHVYNIYYTYKYIHFLYICNIFKRELAQYIAMIWQQPIRIIIRIWIIYALPSSPCILCIYTRHILYNKDHYSTPFLGTHLVDDDDGVAYVLMTNIRLFSSHICIRKVLHDDDATRYTFSPSNFG